MDCRHRGAAAGANVQPGPGDLLANRRAAALGPPIVSYLRELEQGGVDGRLVVLIPETQPVHPWLRVFFNQRGAVLDRAIRRGTSDVVICRLRFRLKALAEQAGGDRL